MLQVGEKKKVYLLPKNTCTQKSIKDKSYLCVMFCIWSGVFSVIMGKTANWSLTHTHSRAEVTLFIPLNNNIVYTVMTNLSIQYNNPFYSCNHCNLFQKQSTQSEPVY